MPSTKTNTLPWSIKRAGPASFSLRFDMRRSADWEQWVLVTADRHLDNPGSDRELQRFHLDQAKERGAPVLDFGDLFDAMQGKRDKRSSKSDLMEGHKESSYLNRIVQDAAKFFEPYVDNLALLSEGNHETAITKHVEYNLLEGLIYALSSKGTPIMKGGYRGWIRFLFQHGNYRTSRNAYWIHGYGGGGPVTRDVIQANRKAVYLTNADYVFSGHTHDQWAFPIERTRLLDSGREVRDRQYHIKVPTYKDEFFNKSGGFHHETGKPPKPTGAWWMRFYWSPRDKAVKVLFIEAET